MIQLAYEKTLKVCVFFFVFLSCILTASAHESTGNGKVHLLVHVDPNDVAVAGRPTTIHVDIQNLENTFSLEKCHCSLYIEKDEKRLFTIPLTAAKDPSIYDAVGVEVSFPNAGTYNVGVEGTPITPGTFSPFTAEVIESVLPEGTDPGSVSPPPADTHSTQEHSQPILETILTGSCLLILLYFLYVERIQKRKL